METDDKYLFKHKRDYLKLFLKIWTMRCRGDDPPVELLGKARKFGQLIGVSEKELKNL